MKLSDDSAKVRVARTLTSASQLIAAVQGSHEDSAYKRAMDALEKLSAEEGISIAFIGGAATIYHGYPRSTEDLDIVVAVDDFDKILKVAYKYGFEILSMNPSEIHELFFDGVPIDVHQQGSMELPSPQEMGINKGVQYAPLVDWLLMKVRSGRMKDQADIVEVMKTKADTELFEVFQMIPEESPLKPVLQKLYDASRNEIR